MNTFENLLNETDSHPANFGKNLPNALESLLAMSNADTSKDCATGTCS
jgi:hypothetical protein